jgi:polyferredoxin
MRGLFFVCGAGGGGEWLAPQARKSWCAWAGAGAVLFELVVEVELLEGWRRRREKLKARSWQARKRKEGGRSLCLGGAERLSFIRTL